MYRVVMVDSYSGQFISLEYKTPDKQRAHRFADTENRLRSEYKLSSLVRYEVWPA
jgi:hypothetical protein